MCYTRTHVAFTSEYIIPFVVKDDLIGQDIIIRIQLLGINDIPSGQYILVPKAIEQLSSLQLPTLDNVNLYLPIGLSFSSLTFSQIPLSIFANRLSSPKQSSVLLKLWSALSSHVNSR